ncbi:MAG: sigma-54 dependent transcriptional regulator [Proteobacteria bacterium]|nr:sigma-54 dependent transcriptional regulator [Pseudomonadota bacterium]
MDKIFKGRILILDDDPTVGPFYDKILSHNGFQCDLAYNLSQMQTRLSAVAYDFILLDMNLGTEQGFDGLTMILKEAPFTKVYILTANGTVERVVEAMRRGASGFFEKGAPIELLINELVHQAQTTVPHNDDLAEMGLIGRSPALQELVEKIKRLKDVDSMILLLGESGTGKELIARAIHSSSQRAKQRFGAINCAAIPENLLESELFGHKRGAFTDAKTDRKGIFELCSHGTLLLDEIGDMPLSLQVKLLRVLQEKEVTPVGASDSIKINTRIIAATHRDILAEAQAKRFREDLYYRLSIIVLHIPPLRQRLEDIPLLVEHFLEIFNRRFNREIRPPNLSIMSHLMAYDWPGNVRELQNVLERSVVLSSDGQIDLKNAFAHLNSVAHPASMLGASPRPPDQAFFDLPLTEAKQAFERSYLEHQLKNCKGQVLEVAERSGRYRADIYRLINRYGLDQAQFKA